MMGKTRILLVDDDAPLAQLVASLLTRAGCEVLTTHTGREGTKLATEKAFNLIVLDVDLPDANGLSICADLKQRHLTRSTPIVLISGRILEEDRKHGLEVGAVDYIPKPFGVEITRRLLSHIKSGAIPEGIT
jgi:DNA-binding response OmpR family regulator